LRKASMVVIVLVVVVCAFVLQGFIEGQRAVDAARSLHVRFAGAEHREMTGGQLYVDTFLILENGKPYDVEIDGGSCNVSSIGAPAIG